MTTTTRRLSAALAFAMSCIRPIASSEARAAAFDGSSSSQQQAPERRDAPRAAQTLPTAPLPVSRADLERYAALEAKSPGAKNYRGGVFVVVFGASALAVVLLVLLILVLL